MHPLRCYSDCLGSDDLVDLLVDPLFPDVQHQFLHVLWSKRNQHAVEEAALNLLQLLQAPVRRNEEEKLRQLDSLRPNTSNRELGPIWKLEASLLMLPKELLLAS